MSLDIISNYPPPHKRDTYSSVFVPTNATPYSSPTRTVPPTRTTETVQVTTTMAASSGNAGVIAGGAIGGIILFGVISGLLFYFLRRKKRVVPLAQVAQGRTFKSRYFDREDDGNELQEMPDTSGSKVEGSTTVSAGTCRKCI